MLTYCAKAYSSCCSQTVSLYLQPFRRDFLGGTAIWCPREQVSLNLENRDLDCRNLRSILKLSYAACPCLFQLVSAQFAFWNRSRSPKSQKKFLYKPLFLRSRSPKVIEFGGNRKPVLDFLLVINSNLGPMSQRYWDAAIYWLKIANFSYPPLI